MTRLGMFLLVLGAGCAGCADALDQRLAIVNDPRTLAILAEPPEAKPGESVTYSILVGSADGPVAAAPSWAYCTAPKAPTEDNIVSTACLDASAMQPLGDAPTITAMLPAETCLVYGGETKPGGFRPRDADPTGGFYQPVRAALPDELAFGLTRITCKLPNVTPAISREYDLTYRANTNPTLDPVALTTVPADTDVELLASWPSETAESYVYFDALGQRLRTRRESLRVSWFATGGALPVDATAVGEDDPATAVSTTWHTPAVPGPAWLYLVLRDSRGGATVQILAITVESP